jgi:type I restriction enzyme S subunit
MIKLPANWALHPLSDLIERLESGVSVNAENIPTSYATPAVLKVSCVSGGVFYPDENKRIHADEIKRARITARKDSLIISYSNTPQLVGECGLVKDNYPNLFLSDKLWQTIFRDASAVDVRWLKCFLTMPNVRRTLGELSNGTSGSMKNITKDDFLALEVMLPPPVEQRIIADIIDQWDCAIEKLEQLIVARIRFKHGLMQQLLTGRKRFPEFEGQAWKSVHLGDIATESSLRNGSRLTEQYLYAVTKAQGMIPMRERVQGESVERCKIVAKNWFAYNPMRLNIGSIARWGGTEDVMVSPDYVVFHCDEAKLDPTFLDHFRRSHQWQQFVEASGDGSVRVRIWFSHLAELKLSLPTLTEQRRIADVLNACDREIDLLRKQLAALKKQKQGLMQKLLTGQIRVGEAGQ